MVRAFLALLLICQNTGGFSQEPSSRAIRAIPLPERSQTDAKRFQLLPPSQTQIDFISLWDPKTLDPGKGIGDTGAASGVCLGDYDADGRPDVFLTRPFGGNRLYRNLGEFRFEDVTQQAGLTEELDHEAWGQGPCFVDIDNDGDLDLYVCSHRKTNRLYINQGDGTFVEQADKFSLDYTGASVTMAFCDYDRDGDLDAYLVTNRLIRNEAIQRANLRPAMRDGRMRVDEPYQEYFDVVQMGPDGSGKFGISKGAEYDHFYRNDDGQFVEATREVLGDFAAAENLFGHAARWFDYDNDGFPDLYVSNDFFGPDQLFHNNGDGTMTDVTRQTLPHIPWYSMGSDAADINNDGLLDLMASDMAFTSHYKSKVNMGDMSAASWFLDTSNPKQQMSNALFINTGANRFLEAAALAGVSNTDWTWAIKFADFDNDGRVDLYITNGYTRNWFDSDLRNRAGMVGGEPSDGWETVWKDQPPLREESLAFRNRGDLQFEKVSSQWGLGFEGTSFGAALGDLDGDGDLDIVTSNFEDQAHIYRNSSSDNHRAVVELKGTKSNRQGIGAVVEIETDAGIQVRDLPCVRGFMSADEPKLFFGLGDAKIIKRLLIRWPSGVMQEFQDLPADHKFVITEAGQGSGLTTKAAEEPPLFVPLKLAEEVRHREIPFDDFAEQPLLPNKLSQLGPGLACGDINGDGLDDYFLAGAKGQAGQLLLGSTDGPLLDDRSDSLWRANSESEEMAALFFDADGDGNLDLYIVCGGNEHQPGDSALQDRLYLNKGDGKFKPAPADALPTLTESGSTVVAADFDRDGDLDLFVGARLVPRSYPETPKSSLLRNEGGGFTDITAEVAAELASVGMVTSAIWSDVDQDGWIDLLVTCEWGPVSLFRNEEGKLTNATQAAGLASLTGWWNGIASGDLDHDGDLDYVVTNFGLNTKYHASEHHPTMIYYGDMDENGRKDIVEAKFIRDEMFPVRGKSCSTAAIPGLAEKCNTFHEFASMGLGDLYGLNKLDSSQRLEATTLESGMLINAGDGKFEFRPLPRLAQISPAFAPAVFDANGDGFNDIYLLQNFFNPQRETVRMDSGVSQLLLGNGKGGFRPVPYRRQGLFVPTDAKALAVTDLTGDGRPDVLLTNNDGPLQAFQMNAKSAARYCTIRLQGRAGNPTAVGSLVTVEMEDGSKHVGEIHCGGGYLSQSSATIFVGLRSGGMPKSVTVRWPDGSVKTQEWDGVGVSLTVSQD